MILFLIFQAFVARLLAGIGVRAGFPMGNRGVEGAGPLASVVFQDTDNIYKFWNATTRAVGSTTSATNPALVFAAAWAALPTGEGMVGYYQDMPLLTSLTPPTSCGIVGPSPNWKTSPGMPAITAAAAMTAILSYTNDGVHLIGVSMSAGVLGDTCVQGAGAQFAAVNASFTGGTAGNQSAKSNGSDTTWLGVFIRAGSTPANAFRHQTSSDLVLWGGRISGGATTPVRVVGGTGHVIGGFHVVNAAGVGPTMQVGGTETVITAMYFDNTGNVSIGDAGILFDGSDIILDGFHARCGNGATSAPTAWFAATGGGIVRVANGTITNMGGAGPIPTLMGLARTAGSILKLAHVSGSTNTTTNSGIAAFATAGTATAFPRLHDVDVNGSPVYIGVASIVARVVKNTTNTIQTVVSVTIPGNYCVAGTTFILEATGSVLSNTVGGATFTPSLRLGGAVDSGVAKNLAQSATRVGWSMRAVLTVYTIGATGTVNGHVATIWDNGNPRTTSGDNTTTVDTTADQVLSINITMNVSDVATEFAVDSASIRPVPELAG